VLTTIRDNLEKLNCRVPLVPMLVSRMVAGMLAMLAVLAVLLFFVERNV